MKIKVPYSWAHTRSSRFNPDVIRRDGKIYRAKKNSCFISKKTESEVGEIREWLVENEIATYSMFGIFDDTQDKIYYSGLVFEFKEEDNLLFFKLRFA